MFKHWIQKISFTSFQISNNIAHWHFCKYFEKYGIRLIRQYIKLLLQFQLRGPLVNLKIYIYIYIYIYTHTHIPNTQLYFFTHWNMLLKTWYQTHFLLYEYCKHVFSQYFLNHSFHIILNNDIRNLQPNGP